MPRITNAMLMEKLEVLAEGQMSLTARVEALEGKATKATSSKKTTKAPAKTTKKVSNSEEFDRDLYEKYAKELGVWSSKYHKVVATVVDGEVKATRAQNKAKVYKKMGYSPKSSK